jgi:hypothetical protein
MTDKTKAELLAESLSSALRRHPHLGNVMTHISSARWPRVDEALRPLFTPYSDRLDVSPLTRNILELICDNRGTTGRIMQPFFQAFLSKNLDSEEAEQIKAWVWKLRAAQPGYISDTPPLFTPQAENLIERLAS